MGQAVLVVDDEQDILDSLESFLSSALAVKVYTARSGPAALALLKDRRVDVILSDYKMPGMNGTEFLAEAAKLAPGVPRIMITAFATPELAAEAAREAGVVLVVSKPFDLKYFVEVVRAVIDHKT